MSRGVRDMGTTNVAVLHFPSLDILNIARSHTERDPTSRKPREVGTAIFLVTTTAARRFTG